jgi:uncharacterized delta-60 repeat protein
MKHFFPYRVRRVLTGGAFILLSMCVTAISAAAQTSAVDAAYAPTVTRSGAIAALVRQPDGKILIGGDIRTVNGTARLNLARLNADGTTDAGFNPGEGPNGQVTIISLQSDGKILIAGTFSAFNGVSRPGFARLNADGTLDEAFSPFLGITINTILVQADGKIVVGGNRGFRRQLSLLYRLNPDGTPDIAFTSPLFDPASNGIRVTLVQPDGKLFIGGQFTITGTPSLNGIARLNANGTLDSTFTPGAGVSGGFVEAAALQSDGKIVIGGQFGQVSGTTRNDLARLNTDGSLDATFDPGTGVDGAIADLLVQPDGKIVIGGGFTQVGGTFRLNFAQLNTDGTVDTGFNPILGPELPVTSLALQPDGKIILGGAFSTFAGISRAGIARVGSTGLLDFFFNPTTQTDGFVDAIAVQSDGKAVIGGFFSTVTGTTRNNLARLNADGTLDTAFNPSGGILGTVSTVVIQSDGKILVGGLFVSAAGATRNSLARLNADGSLDQTFVPNLALGEFVAALAVQSDGKVVIAGGNLNATGSATLFLRRVNADGSADAGFAGPSPASPTSSLGTTSDGIYLGGIISPPPNLTFITGVARLDLNGGRDTAFLPDTGPAGQVDDLQIQPDGKILIAGPFNLVNGAPRTNIARLNTDGSLDTTFVPALPGGAASLSLDRAATGKVVIGGSFNASTQVVAFNGTTNGTRGFVNRLTADGTLDPTFSATIGANNAISAVVAQPDGKILVGGRFTTVGGVARGGLARLLNESSSCNFTISPSSARFPGTGGAAGVIVLTDSDCTWTSSGVPSWVRGVPIRGSGLSSAPVIVDRNTGPARTATFTIAGRSFTVSQAAAPRAATPGQFRPSNGFVYLRNTNDTGFADTEFFYGTANDVPVAGDWDGNGTDSIGIYRDGTFFLRNSNTSGFADIQFPFGAPGDIPLVGDWDGDGIDTVGIVRGNTVFLRNSNTAGNADIQFAYGTATDIFITGDWNGDGIDTIGAFRPSNGFVYIRNANTTGIADFEFFYGQAGDRPVVGDWNADGIDTIGIVRGNQWFLRNSNTSGFADIQYFYGTDTDIPISGNWAGQP